MPSFTLLPWLLPSKKEFSSNFQSTCLISLLFCFFSLLLSIYIWHFSLFSRAHSSKSCYSFIYFHFLILICTSVYLLTLNPQQKAPFCPLLCVSFVLTFSPLPCLLFDNHQLKKKKENTLFGLFLWNINLKHYNSHHFFCFLLVFCSLHSSDKDLFEHEHTVPTFDLVVLYLKFCFPCHFLAWFSYSRFIFYS